MATSPFRATLKETGCQHGHAIPYSNDSLPPNGTPCFCGATRVVHQTLGIKLLGGLGAYTITTWHLELVPDCTDFVITRDERKNLPLQDRLEKCN